MKFSALSNTNLRIITAVVIAAVIGIALLLEAYGIPYLIKPFHAIRLFAVLVALGGIYEMVKNLKNASPENIKANKIPYVLFTALLVLMTISVYFVAVKVWILLLLLMIIVGADVGAWLFGRLIGGDKMWEKLSEHKTWSGQIGGIICGTLMGVMYSLLGADIFKPELIWVGMGVALLSQYGDLTASAIKRRLGIKDFGNVLPGHGGILDRIDGWIYVLPLIWFIITH
ncbi:MAG: phosphatidate cytidylyltransferase [Alphaproteobacteria bacterium]|nr:phosphatidate cytidylyltransferase [Alphaproteobacteria bacterium]